MFARTLCRLLGVTSGQIAAIVRAKLDDSPAVAHTLLVDVRSTGEVASTGVIPTAVNIPIKMLSDVLDDAVGSAEFEETFGVRKPTRGVTRLVFYCAHGVRSAMAVELAEDLGYTGASHFSGGFAEWSHLYEKKGTE